MAQSSAPENSVVLAASPPGLPLPAAGSIVLQSVGGAPSNVLVPFAGIARGSVIGTLGDGRSLVLNLPEETGDLSQTPPSANALVPANATAGYWDLTGAGDSGSFDDVALVKAAGFSDLGPSQFHFVEFAQGSSGGPGPAGPGSGEGELGGTGGASGESGLAIFGDGTPGGAAMHLLDDGSFAANANTLDLYVTGDTTPSGTASGSVEWASGVEVMLIGNAGAPRFDSGSGPGRWLSADVDANQRMTLLDEPVRADGNGGGAILSGKRHRIEGAGASGLVSQTGFHVGTLQVSAFNAVWGETGDYIILGPIHREVGEGGGVLGFAPDVAYESQTALISSNVTFTQNITGQNVLFQRDADAAEIVQNPLALALGSPAAGPGFTPEFVGFLRCPGGQCGDGLTTIESEFPVPTGFIAVSTQGSDARRIAFDDATNRISVTATLRPANDTASTTAAGSPVFRYKVDTAMATNGATSGTFLDDRVFGVASGNGILLNDTDAAESTFLLASSELAGEGGLSFAPGVESDPAFARWGWWAASVKVTDVSGTARTDISIPGTWVAGNVITDEIPFDGTASYTGFAIAHQGNLSTGQITTLPGLFALNYDFGAQEGSIDLSVPGAGLNVSGVTVIGAESGERYTASEFLIDPVTNTGSEFSLTGQFFGAPGNPVAATGGTFSDVNESANTFTQGIFAGDGAFTPGFE